MTVDVMAAFYDRVLRRVRDGLQAYQDELSAVSHQMAARGLSNSGPHLVKRLETFKSWVETVTDQCFEEVMRLPGTQSMHRDVHAPFLHQHLLNFFIAAKPSVFFPGAPESAKNEIENRIVKIREDMESDLRDFQAGLWRPRETTKASLMLQNDRQATDHRERMGHGANVVTVPATQEFPQALLHEQVIAKCRGLFESGHYAEAIEKSFRVVRDRLRDLTHHEKGSDAFGKTKLHVKGAIAPHVDRDFNEGVKFLTMAIDMFRNEKTHTSEVGVNDPVKALQYLVLSSLAMRLLDGAEIK